MSRTKHRFFELLGGSKPSISGSGASGFSNVELVPLVLEFKAGTVLKTQQTNTGMFYAEKISVKSQKHLMDET